MSLLVPPPTAGLPDPTLPAWATGLELFGLLPTPDHLSGHTAAGMTIARARFPIGEHGGQFVAVAFGDSVAELTAAALPLATVAASLLFPERPDTERLLLFGVAPDGALWIPVDWTGAYDPEHLALRSVGEPMPTDPTMAAALVRLAAERTV
jgi:hypothetical protein